MDNANEIENQEEVTNEEETNNNEEVVNEEIDPQLVALEERIPYDEDIFGDNETYIKVLNRLLDDSKYIALSLRFPYQDYSNIELPEKYYNWQLRCCEELYTNIGRMGIKSYAENGLAWTRDSSYLSTGLINEIEPMIGYIKPNQEDGDNNVQSS